MDAQRILAVTAAAALSTLLGACFDPNDAKGLACGTDLDCGPDLQCIESVCGGPPSGTAEAGDSVGDGDGDGDDTTGDGDGDGDCEMPGSSCGGGETCCGDSTCVNFQDEGILCAADCDSGSECAGCCCIPLEGGTNACGFSDLCGGSSASLCPNGGGCALGFSVCEFSSQCCGNGQCLETMGGTMGCFETCNVNGDCVTGCCSGGLCQGEGVCGGDVSSLPETVVATGVPETR